MRYHIQRIKRKKDGVTTCENCDVTVDNLEAYRKALGGASFIYETID